MIYRGWIIKTALSEEKKTLLNGRKNTRKKNIHTIKKSAGGAGTDTSNLSTKGRISFKNNLCKGILLYF
ncbi:hypothetical protein DXA83_20030 [Bacteroides thetaiotaomicron]|nr:hypothetical protein DXA83_20030 [Bacteroides thetaiotaomicron]